MRIKHLLLIALLGTVLGCASNKAQKSTADTTKGETSMSQTDTLLFYRKTSCFGSCPVYDFTLYADGTCSLNAKQHYKVQGEKRGGVAQSKVKEVQQQLEEIGYWSLDRKYDDAKLQDVPSTHIYAKKENKGKWVKSRYGSPERLKLFQVFVETMINEVKWK